MTTKTQEEKLAKCVLDELTPIDMHERYDEMLDECYSFESVGGIFASMSPSRVLKEMDPTAYRCGFNDWIDGELGETVETVEGIDDDQYYDKDEVDEIRERLEDEEGEKEAVK